MRVILVGFSARSDAAAIATRGSSIEIVGEAMSAADARRTGVGRRRHHHGGTRTRLSEDRPSSGDDDAAFAEPLTARETEVLELLAEGLPNKAIASALGIKRSDGQVPRGVDRREAGRREPDDTVAAPSVAG